MPAQGCALPWKTVITILCLHSGLCSDLVLNTGVKVLGSHWWHVQVRLLGPYLDMWLFSYNNMNSSMSWLTLSNVLLTSQEPNTSNRVFTLMFFPFKNKKKLQCVQNSIGQYKIEEKALEWCQINVGLLWHKKSRNKPISLGLYDHLPRDTVMPGIKPPASWLADDWFTSWATAYPEPVFLLLTICSKAKQKPAECKSFKVF